MLLRVKLVAQIVEGLNLILFNRHELLFFMSFEFPHIGLVDDTLAHAHNILQFALVFRVFGRDLVKAKSHLQLLQIAAVLGSVSLLQLVVFQLVVSCAFQEQVLQQDFHRLPSTRVHCKHFHDKQFEIFANCIPNVFFEIKLLS